MSCIPGLYVRPEIDEINHGKTIQLVGFDLKTYEVPDNQRYGNCRLLSDFQKMSHVGARTCGFGEFVYKVKDTREDRIVELKKIDMPPPDESLSCAALREIKIWKSLKHENVVNVLGIAVGRSFEVTYFVLEYCEYDLSTVLDDVKAKAMIEEPHIKYIMCQLLCGLKYIHDQRIIHRDLSCRNVLFTPGGILKITNFESARKFNRTEVTSSKGEPCRWYKAPELLFGATKYTSAVDLWSTGCILGELFMKKPLFPGDTDMLVMNLIIELIGSPSEVTWPGHTNLPLYGDYHLPYQQFNNLWKFIPYKSQVLLHLLNNLLVYNPDLRASVEACLQHEYFYQPPTACDQTVMLRILQVSQELAS